MKKKKRRVQRIRTKKKVTFKIQDEYSSTVAFAKEMEKKGAGNNNTATTNNNNVDKQKQQQQKKEDEDKKKKKFIVPEYGPASSPFVPESGIR